MGAIQHFDFRIGLGRGDSWHYLQGTVHRTLQPNERVLLSAGAERRQLLADRALGRRITYNAFGLGTRLRPATHWHLLPRRWLRTFCVGSQRNGGIRRVLPSSRDITGTSAALDAQLSGHVLHSRQPGGGVCFNPRSYRALQFGLIDVYSITSTWKLRATADTGRQTIDGSGARIHTVDLSLEGRLPHNGRLQMHVARSSVASINSGGAGYRNNTVSLSVSYPF